MPYKKPKIPIFPSLVDVHRRVQDMQINISELDWLECSFGLAKRLTSVDEQAYPSVYEGIRRDSLDVRMWPSEYKSYTFWDLIDIDEYNYSENRSHRRYPKIIQPVALIVCLDNKQISHDQDYNVTHSICRNEMINKLNNTNISSGIFQITGLIENKPVEVFLDYDVEDKLMEPRSCFRIEGTITYTQDCFSAVDGAIIYPTADNTLITADSTLYTVDNIEV